MGIYLSLSLSIFNGTARNICLFFLNRKIVEIELHVSLIRMCHLLRNDKSRYIVTVDLVDAVVSSYTLFV